MYYVPVRPESAQLRWSGLDGLRAIAVVAVVAFHFAPGVVPGGFLGVDIFFVLSGYLITRMIATEYLRFGSLRFGNFYLRRARRLLPGVAALLVAVLAAAAFWRDQLSTVRPASVAAAGYVSNWWLSFAHQSYFVAAGRPSMLQHLWSLAVEEQFYLVWPVLAVGVLAIAPRRWKSYALAGVATLLAAGSTALMAALAIRGDVPYAADASRLYYGTDTHSMGLLLGAAFGALAAGRGVQPAQESGRARMLLASDAAAAVALLALIAVVCTARESSPGLYRGGFLLAGALTAVAVACVARTGSRLGRALDVQPARWLAARSYAAYLWHWPVAVVTRPGIDVPWPAPVVLLVRLGATALLADLTHRYVEHPIRTTGIAATVRHGVRRLVGATSGRAPVGARVTTAGLVGVVLLACGVLASAPKARLSAVQKALASEHGGRALQLGAALTAPPRRSPVDDGTPLPTTVPPSPSSSHPQPTKSAAAAATSLPAVSAFGDSVMLGARLWLDRRFPRGTLDAIEGRQPDPILHDIEHDAAAGRLNPLVVIGVGDNGLIDPGALRQALLCLRAVPRVVVVNNRVGRAWESPNNRTIREVVPHFANATILDWYAVSRSHPGWFYEDGIHLTPAGALAYTRLIAAAAH